MFDQIGLEKDLFRKLDGRRLERKEFKVIDNGEGRIDASDRIVYDRVTGELFYDPDGNPSGPGQGAEMRLFAVLPAVPGLTFADFDLV